MRAAGALGFTKEADDERRAWAAQITAFEKDGKQLDITLADRDRRLFGASEAKLMAMIEQLESEHGADFMPRFLELCRALKDSDAPTLQEVLYYFSLVAGADLAAAQRQFCFAEVPVQRQRLEVESSAPPAPVRPGGGRNIDLPQLKFRPPSSSRDAQVF